MGPETLGTRTKPGTNQDKEPRKQRSWDCTPSHWEESPSHKRDGTALGRLRQDSCEIKASDLPSITCDYPNGVGSEG